MAFPKVFAKKEITTEGSEVVNEGRFDNRFAKAEKKSRREEFVRLRLNVYIVTCLIIFNTVILLPVSFTTWLMNLLGYHNYAVFNHTAWWLFILLWICPYLTWQYSTITSPIRKGHDIKLDWSKTVKGRVWSALLNLTTFHVMSWAALSKFVTHNYLSYLTDVQVAPQFRGILLVDDLDSFILLLFISPVICSSIILFIQIRDFLVNKDLLKDHFTKWEAPFIRRYAHELVLDSCDIIVGYEIDTKKPIVIKEDQRFLHEGVFGATGSGKTSTTILLRIAQDLINIATGRRKMGLVLLEPKGDAVDDVITIAKKLGIPDEKIKVIDPKKAWSLKYNPFSGNRESAAASFQGTLSALTGDQDAFFKGQQNEAAQTYTLLAKIRYGNLTNVTHIQRMFTDARYLADITEEVRKSVTKRKEEKDLPQDVLNELESIDQIVSYFENEVLDYKTMRKQEEFIPLLYPFDHPVHANKQMVENKKDKYVTGAKKYLNEIALNSLLKSLFICDEGEEAFDADKFLLEGGVLLVNTCLAELEELSLMFGQFFIRQFQSAIFRRPKENRIPVYFYIDEFPLYVNESFERILTLGRSYKVGALIAMQSIAQLDMVGSEFKNAILGNTSHKTVFGRGPVTDNEYFTAEFGEELVIEESLNESASPMTSENQTWGYRMNTQKKLMPRFSTTDIRSLPFKQMIVQVVDETNSLASPKKAVGKFVHEAKFIKRYMDLIESEIKSTKEEDIVISEYMNSDRLTNFATSEFTPMLEDLTDGQFEHSDIPSEVYEKVDILAKESQEIIKQREFAQQQAQSKGVPLAEPLTIDEHTGQLSLNLHGDTPNNVVAFPGSTNDHSIQTENMPPMVSTDEIVDVELPIIDSTIYDEGMPPIPNEEQAIEEVELQVNDNTAIKDVAMPPIDDPMQMWHLEGAATTVIAEVELPIIETFIQESVNVPEKATKGPIPPTETEVFIDDV